jgi:hypothetical protein
MHAIGVPFAIGLMATLVAIWRFYLGHGGGGVGFCVRCGGRGRHRDGCDRR